MFAEVCELITVLVSFSYNYVAIRSSYFKLFRDDVSKTTAGDGYVYESYYDDYTPEMENEYSSSSSWQGESNDYGATAQQNEYYQQNENDAQQQQYYPQQ